MAALSGTNVAAPVLPFDDRDVFPTHDDRYGAGGFRVCTTQAERDAISPQRRKLGMWVHCLDSGTVFTLAGGVENANWQAVEFAAPQAAGDLGVFPAAEALGGHRLVRALGDGRVGYADKDTLAHAPCVLGLTLNAAAAGAEARVLRRGEVQEPGWNWTAQQPVFLGNNGLLTQIAPVTGFSLAVGFPMAPDRLFISIRDAIILK